MIINKELIGLLGIMRYAMPKRYTTDMYSSIEFESKYSICEVHSSVTNCVSKELTGGVNNEWLLNNNKFRNKS